MSLSQKYQNRQDDIYTMGVLVHLLIENRQLLRDSMVALRPAKAQRFGKSVRLPVVMLKVDCSQPVAKQAPTTLTPHHRLRRKVNYHRHTIKQQMTVCWWCLCWVFVCVCCLVCTFVCVVLVPHGLGWFVFGLVAFAQVAWCC